MNGVRMILYSFYSIVSTLLHAATVAATIYYYILVYSSCYCRTHLIHYTVVIVVNTVIQLLVYIQITVVVVPVTGRTVHWHTLFRSQHVQLGQGDR